MTPLSTPGSVMRGDVNDRREQGKEIKWKPLINVSMTPISTSGSVVRGDLNDRREKQGDLIDRREKEYQSKGVPIKGNP